MSHRRQRSVWSEKELSIGGPLLSPPPELSAQTLRHLDFAHLPKWEEAAFTGALGLGMSHSAIKTAIAYFASSFDDALPVTFWCGWPGDIQAYPALLRPSWRMHGRPSPPTTDVVMDTVAIAPPADAA